jgi:kinetochore protein NDC80
MTLQDLEQIPEQFFEEAHHWTLAFHYYDCAYGSFLAGQDDFPQEKDALEARYGMNKNFSNYFHVTNRFLS